jgi:hypothetical protein
MIPSIVIALSILLCTCTVGIRAEAAGCGPQYYQCAPEGASRRGVPVIGPDLARFFLELINAVEDIPDGGNGGDQPPLLLDRQQIEGDSLCCA